MMKQRPTLIILLTIAVSFVAEAQQKKPNILIIWGDDIGYWNVSANNQGMMATRHPTLIALPGKARSSPIGMVNKVAPLVVPAL
jgi:hypothetical protein